jgi:uncharacterized tellurite resistance protein B-like protein
MAIDTKTKSLLKILIGAAWIDGEIQQEERDYLRKKAQDQGLAEDPEIRPLLYELVQVQPELCYRWVEEYLGTHPSPEACQELLESLSGLIYSDGSVEIEEAKLLNRIQEINANNQDFSPNMILAVIQKLYQRWVGEKQS